MQAAQIAEQEWSRESPAARICRAAVQPGTTLDSTWAESLSVYLICSQQFLAQLIQGGDAAWLPERRARISMPPFRIATSGLDCKGAGVGGIG